LVWSNAFTPVGTTIGTNGLETDGPYAKVIEMVGAYLVCKTDSLKKTVKFTEDCPTLGYGGKVEVREFKILPEM